MLLDYKKSQFFNECLKGNQTLRVVHYIYEALDSLEPNSLEYIKAGKCVSILKGRLSTSLPSLFPLKDNTQTPH